MSVAFDVASTSNASAWGGGSTATWTHTCTGTDRVLFVATFNNDNGTYPTGVTYNGVAMTLVDQQVNDVSSFYQSLWVIINPASGANSVVVTWASGAGINNCIASSYTGADQTTQPDSFNRGSATSATSITVSTTTVTDNAWLVGHLRSSNVTISNGTNGTIRNFGNSLGSQGFADSAGALTPAGSKSMTLNMSPAQNLWLIVASIRPVSAGGFTPTPLMHMRLMAGGMV